MKLYKFFSPSCGPCRIQDTYLSELGTDIIRVDISQATDLSDLYNITTVPTLMYVDDNGDEVKRLEKITTKEELELWLQS